MGDPLMVALFLVAFLPSTSCGQHCAVRHRGVPPSQSTKTSVHVVHGLLGKKSHGGGTKGAQGQVRTMTNKEVLRFWRLAPCDVEARVRRLKWAQTLVQNPAHHAQLITALFGKLPAEQQATLGKTEKFLRMLILGRYGEWRICEKWSHLTKGESYSAWVSM